MEYLSAGTMYLKLQSKNVIRETTFVILQSKNVIKETMFVKL